MPVEKLAPEQTWRLVVESTDGATEGQTVDTTVSLVNLNPTAVIETKTSRVFIGETTVLSADASTDDDGEILVHRWTWKEVSLSGRTLRSSFRKTR